MINNIKIKALSPVYIGGNDSKNLSSLSDFILDNDEIRLVDQHKLDKIFENDKDILNDYISIIKHKSHDSFDLKDFLEDYRISCADVVSYERIPIVGDFSGKEIHRFILENGNLYIPGSSIKGVIRNALAYCYLLNKPILIEKKLNEKFNRQTSFEDVDRKIFGKDPFNDILKILIISDSKKIDDEFKSIYVCQNFHLKKRTFTNPINYECIKPDTASEFRIKIKDDFNIEKLEGFNNDFWKNFSIEKIFKSLNKFHLKLLEREIEELQYIDQLKKSIEFCHILKSQIQSAKPNEAFISVGIGSTIFGKTILSLLTTEQIRQLRNEMGNTAFSQKFGFVNKKASEKFPVTRLTYHEGGYYNSALGWMKVEY